MTKNIPLDKKLYETVKKESDKKFDENTSIYKSSWIVREYKKRGGKYKGKKMTLVVLKDGIKKNG